MSRHREGPPREPLIVRIADRLLVGEEGGKEPFLLRHDWVIPVGIFASCGVFAALVVIAELQGWGRVLMWVVIGVLALCAAASIPAFVRMFRMTRGPLPSLDRTTRTARVVLHADDADGGRTILVAYRDAAGDRRTAQLADIVHESSDARFSPGSHWEVYAFRDLELADSVVFLTEAHDDVWRDGYRLDGVRIGGETGPLKPGPGSPFLRHGSKWEFAP